MADKEWYDRPIEEMDNLDGSALMVREMCGVLDSMMAIGASAAEKRDAYLWFLRVLARFIACHGTATHLGELYTLAAFHAVGLYYELAQQDWGGSSDIFPLKKSPGRARNLAYTYDHAAGAAAITVLMEKGSSETDAARRVSRVLEKKGTPIRQSTAHSKRTAWEALQDKRDKIISDKRGVDASSFYDLWLMIFRQAPNLFEDWLASKETLIEVGKVGGFDQVLTDVLEGSATDK